MHPFKKISAVVEELGYIPASVTGAEQQS